MRSQFGMDCPPTSNLPLRNGKASLYEGGTREPCIVVRPGVTQPGSVSEAFVQSVDFHPTLLDMLGLAPKPGTKFDGLSFAPALRGQPVPRDTILCHFPHHTPASSQVAGTTIRQGDWKLHRLYADNEDQTDRFELYNLRLDLGETNNLAARFPDKVKELNALIEAFLTETKAVVPKPNPDYRVTFTTPDSLRRLRLDGSLSPTQVEFDWIRLRRKDATVLKAWEF